jgi:hypothetical protein
MQQQLHLFVVDGERKTALAARYGARWLLPTLACGERIRAGPAIVRWCGEHGIVGDVAGQWLGRLDIRAADWLVAIAAKEGLPRRRGPLDWFPLDALAGGKSVLDYQTWAVSRTLEAGGLPRVAGPFGTLDWPGAVRDWIQQTVSITGDVWTPFRTSAYEVVLGVTTREGRVYFKGLTAERTAEIRVTQQCAAIAPGSFARTIALEERSDGMAWWLTEECRGRPAEDPSTVAAALARLQQRLGPDIRRTWIPMDLDPTNVLIDHGRVAFIDLDDSSVGFAPLAMAGFALRCKGDRAAAYRTYEESWSPRLAPVDWRRLERAATIVQSRLGWRRVKRSVARGELFADLEVVRDRIRARLARALHRG